MNQRKQFIAWLFEKSQKVYTNLFKHHEAWGISKNDLLQYPETSLGKHLGNFLDNNGFELIAKVERHDAYHVLTGYGIEAQDEIALQYLCFGNGKRSSYLFAVLIIGTILLPDYLNYYYKSYCIGKNANAFHHFDFKKLLNVSLTDLRFTIFSKAHISKLN